MPAASWIRRTALLLALMVVGAPPAAAGPTESTVWIDVARADGQRFKGYRLPPRVEGMGIVTGARQITTAAHVVWGASTITVTDAAGVELAARVQRLDADTDVALLSVERPLGEPAVLRVRPAAPGEPVQAVGLRQRDGSSEVSLGAIGATHWTSHGFRMPLIFTGIKGEPGMSGGGLFDQRGELLGIIVRIERRLGYLVALPLAGLGVLGTL